MSLRSDNRKVYAVRMAFVVLFCLAVHALIVSEFLGGGSTLCIWKPERMRVALASLIIIGIAAYEFRPKAKEDDPDEGVLSAPVAEKDAEASAGGARASRLRVFPLGPDLSKIDSRSLLRPVGREVDGSKVEDSTVLFAHNVRIISYSAAKPPRHVRGLGSCQRVVTYQRAPDLPRLAHLRAWASDSSLRPLVVHKYAFGSQS